MELVSNDKRLQKLINKCTFKHSTSYNENLNAVSLENKIIEFCKPIYIGNLYINSTFSKTFSLIFFNFYRFFSIRHQ